MEYLLGKDVIRKTEESDLNKIKCVAELDFNFDSDYLSLYKSLTNDYSIICNGTIRDISLKENVLEICKAKICYLANCTYRRQNKAYFCFNGSCSHNENIDQYIEFNQNITRTTHVEYSNDYLVLIAEFKKRSDQYDDRFTDRCFLLCRIIHSGSDEIQLKEVFRKMFDSSINHYKICKVIFNASSQNVLLIMQKETSAYLMTFDIETFQFTVKPWLVDGSFSIFTRKHWVFSYCYHNILKEIIIIVDRASKLVLIIKDTKENGIYLYKKSKINEDMNIIHRQITSFCSVNRSNNIVIYFKNGVRGGSNVCNILPYDVLKGKIYDPLCYNNRTEFEASDGVFFNQSGEEIFVTKEDEHKLCVFVYKSNVNSLKYICQMIVLQQYTKEQLNQMSLPKYILYD